MFGWLQHSDDAVFPPILAVKGSRRKKVGCLRLEFGGAGGQFAGYGPLEAKKEEEWNNKIAAIPDAPAVGALQRSFVLKVAADAREYQKIPDVELAWQSVIERLARTERLKECTCFDLSNSPSTL